MTDASFLGLAQNAALLLAMALLCDVAANRWRTAPSVPWQAVVGLMVGIIGIIVMLTPWTFGSGIIFDTRSVMLGTSGLFFGPFPTTIAMGMTASFRYYQGGTGVWTGIAVILASGCIGIVWRHYRRRPLEEISWRELFLFGIVIHMAMLGLMFTLPSRTALLVLSKIALPVMLIYPAGTALLGTLMVNRMRLERTGEALRESERKYRLVVENAAEAILIAQDGILKYINPVTMRILGYSEEELLSKPFIEILHPDDREKLITAHIRRMKGETIQPVQQFRVICKDGSIKWADSKAVVVSWDNKPATLNFIDEVTERKKVEETLNRSFSQLRKALGATVQAIAVMVETRDPYTAGHQRRVADLARSIAVEMNLLRDQVDGIRLAGIIHDLGKISIPAEILSKPIRLTDIEFTLIKTHPQSGYDILKDMDFPWPIARMVLEHHERINGSGYPHGLTGDQLLIESRVLTVADVVEAMASHRPYRAGLGIEEALQEIEKNRGVLYDRNAVDACLRLFREKNFKLQEV